MPSFPRLDEQAEDGEPVLLGKSAQRGNGFRWIHESLQRFDIHRNIDPGSRVNDVSTNVEIIRRSFDASSKCHGSVTLGCSIDDEAGRKGDIPWRKS
jgi:hypothetical protein